MTQQTEFEPLNRLFRGDREKVRRALEVFHRVTQSDLAELDAAHAGGDWTAIARLMHKMKSACLQIGESKAGEAAYAAERASAADGEARAMALAEAREELGQVQQRVAGYLSANQQGEVGR